ncbi:MAG: hypothetical protein C4518_14865 [Desulfobacteraceae bacterium]|nr:MAG: hypothetical protein C4518_14865 [Desulfobacteraceae bacterium]
MKPAFPTILCFLLMFCAPAMAAADGSPWRTELGYRFLNNADELKDTCKHIAENSGENGDVYNFSISLNIQPYRQFDNGFQIGAGIGPLIIVAGDAWHLLLPVNATLGQSFFVQSPVSPYIKTGISYHLSDGKNHSESTPGLYAGMGIRFFNKKPVKMGMEIAYDSARTKLYDPIERKSHTILTGELTLCVFADF